MVEFAPELLQLLLKGAKETIVYIAGPEETDRCKELAALNLRLNLLRVRARETSHPMWKEFYRCQISWTSFRKKTDGVRLEFRPKDSNILGVIREGLGEGAPPIDDSIFDDLDDLETDETEDIEGDLE